MQPKPDRSQWFLRPCKVTKMERELIVLPKSRREAVLKLAHDSSGHLSSRKVVSVVERCFTWPKCRKDVTEFCRSCVVCQKVAKTGVK